MAIPSAQALKSLLEAPSPQGWIAPLIDHTFLKPEGKETDIEALCREAIEHKLGAVCVRPNFVRLAAGLVKGSGVKVVSVVGFPTGLETSSQKAAEARAAIRDGADEIDMVINVPLVKARKLGEAEADILTVREACAAIPLKVILETCLLDQNEKIVAAAIAKAAGAAFLKTSTGFSSGGATEADIALMRDIARDEMGVKASGGVRTQADALRMILAGANRIGTSNGVAIVLGKSPGMGVY